MKSSLALYAELITKIDAYEKLLIGQYGSHLFCRKGCSGCCILESVCSVEAFILSKALASCPPQFLSQLISSADKEKNEQCVFLQSGGCSLYAHRPVICRTHGYPILIDGKIDYCPKNFTAVKTIESQYILHLAALNESLARINLIFLRDTDDQRFMGERFQLKDILMSSISEKQ